MSERSPTGLMSTVRLNQGVEIPWLGLGVFQTEPGPVTERAVRWALDAGYRLIDTAAMYRNEEDVGRAIRASGVARDELFVTTKLWYSEQGYESALKAGRESLARLGLDRIDLYLIHWPRAPSPQTRLDSWRALERLREEGVCRAIGVSNYTVRHLEELRTHSSTLPAVNQVEFHPWVYDPELLRYLAQHAIQPEAYTPLTRGRRLDDPTVARIAQGHGRSVAQVLLRWGLQHGIVVIPKSIREERIRENARVFDFALTPDEMARLDALRGGGRITQLDPESMA
jgi:methylglyoxal/glyoxal reductase